MSPTDRPALSVAETADLLGISRWLVQQAVRDGSLPSVRVGRRILIPKVQLEALLAGQSAAASVESSAAQRAVVRLAAGQ
jgi:excisionase family DNA binding protein